MRVCLTRCFICFLSEILCSDFCTYFLSAETVSMSNREEAHPPSNYSFQMSLNTERRSSKSELSTASFEFGPSQHTKPRQESQWYSAVKLLVLFSLFSVSATLAVSGLKITNVQGRVSSGQTCFCADTTSFWLTKFNRRNSCDS